MNYTFLSLSLHSPSYIYIFTEIDTLSLTLHSSNVFLAKNMYLKQHNKNAYFLEQSLSLERR